MGRTGTGSASSGCLSKGSLVGSALMTISPDSFRGSLCGEEKGLAIRCVEYNGESTTAPDVAQIGRVLLIPRRHLCPFSTVARIHQPIDQSAVISQGASCGVLICR